MSEMYLQSKLVLFVVFALLKVSLMAQEDRQVYIVYMGNAPKMDHSSSSLSSKHLNMLQEVVDSRYVEQSLVRSYTRSLNGFAAYLTPHELQILADHEEVVSIIPSGSIKYERQTTRSWDFMGLTRTAQRNPAVESDIIIGVIDDGIWPESESFDDENFGPPPKKWKGVCNGGPTFTCNNKVIGARIYDNTDSSARDTDGHGTACASIAAGNYVEGASLYGIAKGTARGGVPSARIAVYKVCSVFCSDVDILAAFDDGIADGVDIISISITTDLTNHLENDVISIGSLHAVQNGILVVQSAGNYKWKGTVRSIQPWIFSVGASTTDRRIISRVVVENGSIFTGAAVNSNSLVRSGVPVVFGSEVSRNCSYAESLRCGHDCIEPTLVKGKILLCNNTFVRVLPTTMDNGAIGLIAALGSNMDAAEAFPIPATFLYPDDFKNLLAYFNTTKSRKVDILPTELVKNYDAPRVARFSSRGPNTIFPDILKPDVTAPGIDILFASPATANPFLSPHTRPTKFRIDWGTSYSCPHVAGAAAYVKSFHPNWSPASIKSALMTTAKRMDSTKDPLLLAEFAYGAGHIDPTKAIDPGLVYDTPIQDYTKMYCGLGFDTTKLRKLFGENVTCIAGSKITPKDINYPTMTSLVNSTQPIFSVKFQRSATNVGTVNSTYFATTSNNANYKIKVEPNILSFEPGDQTKSFEVTISGETTTKMVSAWLEWSDNVHRVVSPIVIYLDTL